MSAPLSRDPTFWLPKPDNPPPVEERAKNLARHFGLILLVIGALGLPLVLTIVARRGSGTPEAALRDVGAALAEYRAKFGEGPAGLEELGPGAARQCPACGRAWDGWWNYRSWSGGAGYRWKDRLGADAPPAMPVVWCPSCGAVLFAGGEVSRLGSRGGPGGLAR